MPFTLEQSSTYVYQFNAVNMNEVISCLPKSPELQLYNVLKLIIYYKIQVKDSDPGSDGTVNENSV